MALGKDDDNLSSSRGLGECVGELPAYRPRFAASERCVNYNIRTVPVLSWVAIACAVRHAAPPRACIRWRGITWTHPRIAPCRGGSVYPPFFFCLALSRFSYPLPPNGMVGCAVTERNKRFLCHSQSDDIPHDASPFINHIRGQTHFDTYFNLCSKSDRSSLLYRQSDNTQLILYEIYT